MNNYNVEFLKEANQDLDHLNKSVKIQVLKGIKKVSKNPLPQSEGGYGKPLGNKFGLNLTNLLKIKFLDIGIRVVYKIERKNNIMNIIIISAREDLLVYQDAYKRRLKYDI